MEAAEWVDAVILTEDEYAALQRVERESRVDCVPGDGVYRELESLGLLARSWTVDHDFRCLGCGHQVESRYSFWRLTAAGREALSEPHCIVGKRTTP